MTSLRLRGFLAAACFASALAAGVPAESPEVRTVGRLAVSLVEDAPNPALAPLRAKLEAAHAAERTDPASRQRILHLSPTYDDPSQFNAIIHDPASGEVDELRLDAEGAELSRRSREGYIMPGEGEIELGRAAIFNDPYFGPMLESGEVFYHEAMPPITVTKEGRRLVNVCITGGENSITGVTTYNEIAGVDVVTGEVVRYPENAPPTAIATRGSCGPNPASGSGTFTGAVVTVSWPAENPVWNFNVRRPSQTRSGTPDGRGLELTHVRYQGRYVLAAAHMPVLNVEYNGDACGPYRDWLYQENHFRAPGTDLFPGSATTGFRLASSPSQTICEDNNDTGTFQGVVFEDLGDELLIRSECSAGWYRYILEWRLGLNGRVNAVLGFSTTVNSCVCVIRRHHGYWRYEFAPDGTPNSTTDGLSTLAYLPGDGKELPIATEQSRIRAAGEKGVVRMVSADQTISATITPGSRDLSAVDDAYAVADYWFLARNDNEIEDAGSANTRINLAPYTNGESVGSAKRSVLWMHSGFLEDYQGVPPGGIYCTRIGPTLQFSIAEPTPPETGVTVQ
ncbi:MAG: hypothetical protein SF028_06385 [Candidatus Sumerlaeia bacterium]|nr:hypothetical protein [Candidatus Sumerlaeia bacterium]